LKIQIKYIIINNVVDFGTVLTMWYFCL